MTTPPLMGQSTSGWSRSRKPRHRQFRRFSFILLVPLLFGGLGSPAAPVSPAHADELADARARQAALAKQVKAQKEAIAQISAMQADLGRTISSTTRELANINADLVAVRKSVKQMVVRIEAVKAQYFTLVAQVQLLDNQLVHLQQVEKAKRSDLGITKALLADRIRQAYDTDRTSMLETFLSGGSFSDVISEVSYINDFAEQDRLLAEQIVRDQATLAAIHETVESTRVQTDTLRVETAKQKAELDKQLVELKAAQARLKQLEKETARALAIQKADYAQLLKNKKDLARAIATTKAAQSALSKKINDLAAQQVAAGNIPSKYNGKLDWPMKGTVTNEFGCSSYPGYGPGNGCEHFHNGIDIVNNCGSAIRAAGSGTIGYVGWNWADGPDPAWMVVIIHDSGILTWYAHMQPTAPAGVRFAARVRTGKIIGYEGATGHATGCHLHWMVQLVNGEFANPRLFL